MSIREDAAQAKAERDAILTELAALDVASLEALRLRSDQDNRLLQACLDQEILARKRAVKAELEELAVQADFLEKVSLPIAAAIPLFVTFLFSEKVLPDPWRTTLMVAAYLAGGGIWAVCRGLSLRFGKRAKVGSAGLGKVD
jgi:hypothetical protein